MCSCMDLKKKSYIWWSFHSENLAEIFLFFLIFYKIWCKFEGEADQLTKRVELKIHRCDIPTEVPDEASHFHVIDKW